MYKGHQMKRRILEAITLSELAYENQKKVELALVHKAKHLKHIDIPSFDIEGFFYETENTAWVVIRGTEMTSINDWFTNLDCSFTPTGWGDIHHGFYQDALMAYHSIRDDIAIATARGKEVIFTGHSQGAAVATLMFAMHANSISMCIPIESPRCFSKAAAETFGTMYGHKVFQVINNNDVVPRLPPRVLGYRHIPNANLRYINRKGKVLHKVSKWNKIIDNFLGLIRDIGKPGLDGIKDHDIGDIKNIWKNQM